MQELAPGVWCLHGFPPWGINVYLVGDVLIDAGARWSGRSIARQIEGRPLRLLALTHSHPDHQGSARFLCQRRGIPLACHSLDEPAVAGREAMRPASFMLGCSKVLFGGPSQPASRILQEGDDLAGFRVLHTPGHTPGHISLFREVDRVAIVGDVINTMHLVTMRPGLHEPPTFFTDDSAENRRSIRRLADLEPRVVCAGHGPPWRNSAAFRAWAESLPPAGETTA